MSRAFLVLLREFPFYESSFSESTFDIGLVGRKYKFSAWQITNFWICSRQHIFEFSFMDEDGKNSMGKSGVSCLGRASLMSGILALPWLFFLSIFFYGYANSNRVVSRLM